MYLSGGWMSPFEIISVFIQTYVVAACVGVAILSALQDLQYRLGFSVFRIRIIYETSIVVSFSVFKCFYV